MLMDSEMMMMCYVLLKDLCLPKTELNNKNSLRDLPRRIVFIA